MIEETRKIYLLKSDIIFKNTFNTKRYLKRLLESTLKLKVSEVYLANTEMTIESVRERRKFLDLIVYTDKGIINCELNHGYKEELHNRNFLYFCKLISSSIKKAESYTKIEKHIQLNITWNLQKYLPFDVTNRKIVKCYIKDEKTNKKIYDDIFEIVHINMDYYEKIWYDGDIKKEDPFIMLLAATSLEEMEKISEGDKIMEEVKDKVQVLNLDPEIAKELVIENEEEKIKNTLLEKGEKQGEKKGILFTAKNLLQMGIDISKISEATGLTKEEIENLK